MTPAEREANLAQLHHELDQQGLPATVEDEVVLDEVVHLLGRTPQRQPLDAA